jgi:arylsulfatase A-like enzyme
MCTPSRYAFMTGRYAWRQPAGASVLSGNSRLCIDPGSPTVPSILKQAGYATGVVGKWHLGLGDRETDYNHAIRPGPLEVGYDYAFILPATGDRVPCVYVENHNVVGYDPADPVRIDFKVRRGDSESLVLGIPRIGGMKGGKTALWSDTDMADTFARKAIAFVEKHKSSPFFLYLATHDIHVPRVPHARFRGSSGAGVRGDVMQQFDATVGSVLETLDRLGLTENTLVIATSDNGGVLDPNGADVVNAGTKETNNGHRHNGPLRGDKGEPIRGRPPGPVRRTLARSDQGGDHLQSIGVPRRHDRHIRSRRQSEARRRRRSGQLQRAPRAARHGRGADPGSPHQSHRRLSGKAGRTTGTMEIRAAQLPRRPTTHQQGRPEVRPDPRTTL